MQRVSSGYTIIEVMIFLAISAALMGAALNLVSGRQSETEFNQKMRDTQSKIQDWLNDVSTGFTGGDPSQLNCSDKGNGGRPYVVSGTPSADPECVFLGKAIQFTDSNNKKTVASQDETLYIYSVFGLRLSPATGTLPASMDEANPTAAVGKNGGGSNPADLTETFSLAPAHITSVCSIPQGSNSCSKSHLLGFMNSFNTEQNTSQNGSEDLSVFQYDFNGDDGPADQTGSNGVLKCLQVQGSCKNPSALKSFMMCLSDGKRTAEITITSSGGVGASTKLDYVAC
jgi:pilin/secretion family protein with methylation motif